MESIAIIGLAFKLPQDVEDEQSFWEVLEQGKSLMTEWPASRVNVNAFARSQDTSLNVLKSTRGHFLNQDLASFDAPFFGISAKEASSMDPEQRTLLETSYHALENAGLPLDTISGSETGVFVGSMESDYHRSISKDPDSAPMNTATGVSVTLLANRLSWYFDLKGPSLQVNTACSSSMIALDLACQSLRSGQSSTAIIAGLNLMLDAEFSLYLSNMNMLSSDGLCHSFDNRADGYSRGEGVVVMVLKKLSTAIADGDNIRAIIRGSGSNQDGRTPGITQPSSTSQEQLIRQVYRNCKLGFESTRYIEAHGTGTQIGDTTEVRALGAVFRSVRSPRAPLFVGSVKSNIGHLEGGSGLAGIVKSIFILEKGVIPPNALFEVLNTKINARRNNIQIPTSCVPWPSAGLRRVSVNSFGFGGSNAHTILDDAYHTLELLNTQRSLHVLSGPEDRISEIVDDESDDSAVGMHRKTNGVPSRINGVNEDHTEPIKMNGIQKSNGKESHANLPPSQLLNGLSNKLDKPFEDTNGHSVISTTTMATTDTWASRQQLLVLSARDEAALQRVHQQLSSYFIDQVSGTPSKLQSLAYSLSKHRTPMTMRSFVVASPETNALPHLEDVVRSRSETQVCFVFTGQGAQYARMGLDLMQYDVFKTTLVEADNAFRALGAEWSLFNIIESEAEIGLARFSQPICTALQIALIELLKSFDITPATVVGHSSGEIGAAYATGALNLGSACKIAYHRGRLSGHLISSISSGAMLSANLEEGQVRAYIDKALVSGSNVHVACVNSPSNVTLAGPEQDIDSLKSCLDADGIFAHKLNTGIAYHTPVMQAIAEEYISSLGTLEAQAHNGAVTMISSVTGHSLTATELLNPRYWSDNLTSPVRFVDAVQYLASAAPRLDNIKPVTDYVEIGPHGALRRPLMDTLGLIPKYTDFRYVSALSKTTPPVGSILRLVGHLFCRGHSVSVAAANQITSNVGMAVDLPKYPFDRTNKYWYESRLSRDWRLRGTAPKTVLGIRASDWNPLEPRWRRFLDIAETPWIADHVVDGAVVYPAAAMVVMALEAVKQTVQSGGKMLRGFLIKEAMFSSPIIVQEDKRKEVVTVLRTIKQAYERDALRFEVLIFSVGDEERWTESFKATIHAQPQDTVISEVDGGRQLRAAEQGHAESSYRARLSCDKPIVRQDFYSWLDDHGLFYGPAFALSQDICWDGTELCIARVQNTEDYYEGIVHPTVLDNCLQLCCVAPSNGLADKMATCIPSSMRDVWISATGWQYPSAEELSIMTKSNMNVSSTGLNCSITAINDSGTLLCHAKHVGMSAVANQQLLTKAEKHLVHRIEWKPQLALLSKTQLLECCDLNNIQSDDTWAVEYCIALEDALRARLARILPELSQSVHQNTPDHFQRFVKWIQRQLQHTPGRTTEVFSEESLSAELARLRDIRPSWRLYVDVLENLPSIIRGDVNALDLLFTTPVAQDLYDDFFARTCNERLFSYVELAVHQNPDMKILEVGAGTGGMTNQMLTMFKRIEERTGGTGFREYVYSDVSPAYFEGAKERFQEYNSRMTFTTLDLDDDIASSVEPGSCDMVLAGSVLHATKNLTRTLSSLRRALKPGGILIFLEITQAPECFAMSFGFGVLPGWWCAEEDDRKWCPTVPEDRWNELLLGTGFDGVELVCKDHEDVRANYVSVITSTASATPDPTPKLGRILLVANEQAEQQRTLAVALSNATTKAGVYECVVVTLADVTREKMRPTDLVLFLADLEGTLLVEASDETFRFVQLWIQQSVKLLWVTASSVTSPSFPNTALKDGLLRVVRAENSSKRIVSLTMEHDANEIETCQLHITTILQSAFEDDSSDTEYIIRDGKTLTGRLVMDVESNHQVNAATSVQTKHEAWLPGPSLKLHVGTRGSLESLCFIEDEYPTNLGPTEIEIETQSWAVGFRDVFGALGRLDENEFGTDCAGVVSRVGSQCTRLSPGDKVCMSQFGCMRTHVYCDEADAFKLPSTLSLDESSGVINPVMTAWYSLVDIARLQKGEKILIHAAAGATGQVAVQVAQMLGAEVFATVGYEHKKQLLMDEYGVPASNIFYSRDLSFVHGIQQATDGYGVDVVLNSLTGDGLRSSWECVAPYGRFIEIGKADIHSNASLPMASFSMNRTFTAVDMRGLTSERRKPILRALFHKTMDMVEQGLILCPKPLTRFTVTDIEHAFRHLQSGKSSGRIIVTLSHSDIVPKRLVARQTCTFDPKSSYLVIGGLGGVGRCILRWMVSRGARQLIVPSRSGLRTKAAIELVDELLSMGVMVKSPKCDASDATALRRVLHDCAPTMGPIKGCINAAMVLRDSVFDNMTHTQWQTTIRSKIMTSWNLHYLLPAQLDFFVLLSSVAGVLGNPGQSNYAAGCTFQDALSQYRNRQGQTAVSIDLGPMSTVGFVAENAGVKKTLEKFQGLKSIEEGEFLALMNILCDPKKDSKCDGQVTLGVATPSDLLLENGTMPSDHMQRSLFAYFTHAEAESSASTQESGINAAVLFRKAESLEEMERIVLESLSSKLARALSTSIDDVDATKALHLYGVDSLVAVEIRNWIMKEFTADVPVFELMSGKSVAAIATLVCRDTRARAVPSISRETEVEAPAAVAIS